MRITHLDIYDSKGRLRRPFEMWSIYAAFTQPSADQGLIKIGVSSCPYERFYQIHTTSPFPVEVALWCPVGDSSKVRRLESRIKKAFAHRNTRGEWFRFNLADAGDKEEFHGTIRGLFEQMTGRSFSWTKATKEQIQAAASLTFSK